MFSNTEEEHLQHLGTIPTPLKTEEVYVEKNKCEFMTRETEFLGLIVGRNGIRVNPDKAEVIGTRPKPTTITELRCFIGLLQFFRQFFKGFFSRAASLTALTRKAWEYINGARNAMIPSLT